MKRVQKEFSRILNKLPYIKWYKRFARDNKSSQRPKNLKQDLWAYLQGFNVETVYWDGINE